MEKLTDEQVAALTGRGKVSSEGTNEVWIEAEPVVYAVNGEASAVLQALALEVQQTRARRCGKCHWWTHVSDQWGRCNRHAPHIMVMGRVPDTWFCADFAPK